MGSGFLVAFEMTEDVAVGFATVDCAPCEEMPKREYLGLLLDPQFLNLACQCVTPHTQLRGGFYTPATGVL